MRNLTGGDYDDEPAANQEQTGAVSQGASDLRMSSNSPKYHDEGNSEMEHPIKNEIEVKGFPMPGGFGGGFGGDGLGLGLGGGGGGLLIGALLGRGLFNNGFGNGDGPGGGGAAIGLAALSKLGDLQAQVPLSALQTQNALCMASNDIQSGTLQQTISLGSSIANLALGIQQGLGGVKDAVQTTGTVLLQGQDRINASVNAGTFATVTAVRDDGDKTRALISSINLDNLNRQLTVAENTITELRLHQGRRDDQHGIEIQMVNNQNQNQLQFQAQAQALTTLSHGLLECNQIARATNQNVLVGNTGVTATGPQTANPTNVKV